MRIRIFYLLILLSISSVQGKAQILSAPVRSDTFLTGSQFAQSVRDLPLQEREDSVYAEVVRGNIPAFLRKMVPVSISDTVFDEVYILTYYVIPDYLSIGSDEDFFRIPVSPIMAQKIASLFDCSLPTTKMVDNIYRVSTVRLTPRPIPPSEAMVTINVFEDHNDIVKGQRDSLLQLFPLGSLTAGHKKDVVITNQLLGDIGKTNVAIYGWHRSNRDPIQYLYVRHLNSWVDYSHGIRLVSNRVILNGKPMRLSDIFMDPIYSKLISKEGRISFSKYPSDVELVFRKQK